MHMTEVQWAGSSAAAVDVLTVAAAALTELRAALQVTVAPEPPKPKQPRVSKKTARKQLRSRNGVIDTWLTDDAGHAAAERDHVDTFADLEDFIVPMDEEPV